MDIHYKKTNSILDEICDQKVREIQLLDKQIIDIKVEDVERYSFFDALSQSIFGIIAEAKKASPSEGIIRKDFDILNIVQTYEKLNVTALSILTDEKFFHGNIENLKVAKKNTKLPVLRKDFIIHESQIFESKAIGADAILLIASILEKSQLKEYMEIANEIGLDVLFETHNEEEIEIALDIKANIIGINNRDLKTFKTDLNNFEKLSKLIPDHIITIAESGIDSKKHIEYLNQNKANGVLLGTTFMKSEDIESKYNMIFA